MPPKKQPEVSDEGFNESMKNNGFNEKTLKILADNEFTDENSLKLLAKNPEAIEELELSLQQRLLLKEYVCRCGSAVATSADTGKLHDVMSGILGAQGGHQPTAQLPGVLDPQAYIQGGCVPKKYLDIIDYINMIPPMADEQVVCEDGGVAMVLKSGAKRPPLDSVSVEEWALANTRIMNELMKDSDVFCLSDYMAYTIKTCQLFKQFDRSSVLQFDREYRYLQSVYKFRWGTDTPHLHTTHLRPKTIAGNNARQFPSTQNRAFKHRQSSEVCRLYNTSKGCHFAGNCKYVHKCNYAGCSELHSRAHAHGTDEQPKD